MSKRKTLAIVSAVAAFAAVSASAATLGGITGTSLGADLTVVASCDTDGVAAGFTTAYSATPKEYTVSAVNLTGIAAGCAGKVLNVTLADTGGASLGSGTVTSIVGTTATVSFVPAISAKAVSNIAVVISG